MLTRPVALPVGSANRLLSRSVRPLLLVLILGVGLIAPASARGSFTTVYRPPSGEDGHEKIFEHVYGGDFTLSNSNYTNGTVTARRIDDSLSTNGVLGLIEGAPGAEADQVWHDGFASALAKARFASYQQSFGYFLGASGAAAYTDLFDVSGTGYNVTGTAELTDMRGLTWRWGRDRGLAGTHSSLVADNADGRDHLVTYRVDGLNDDVTTWMLFWEDMNVLPGQPTSDRDLNDLVVELKATSGTAHLPEPTSMSVMLGCLALAMLRRHPRATRC